MFCKHQPLLECARDISLAPCRDTARLLIRKIQFAPNKTGAGPKASLSKQFMMSDKLVHVDAYMEKEVHPFHSPLLTGLCLTQSNIMIMWTVDTKRNRKGF